MAWLSIAQMIPQYVDANGDPYSGAVLKAYENGTATVINMATDTTGATTATSIALNSNGYPEVTGTQVIPHVEESYKLSLYPNQTAADSDTGPIWTIDNLTAPVNSVNSVDEKAKVSANDTTDGFLNGKIVAGAGIALTENNDGGNETLSIAAARAQVANHIRAGNMQLHDGDAALNPHTILQTTITEGVFESFGPTGSGADNEWLDMDNLPATATVIIVDIVGLYSTVDANAATLGLFAAQGDIASPVADLDSQIFLSKSDPDLAIANNFGTQHRIMIPLGPTNQDFKLTWSSANADNESIAMYYRGFITD